MSLKELKDKIKKASNPQHAINLQRFFKTGPGEYGEGDIFVGIKVPVQRKIAKEHLDLTLDELKELLNSKIHEERLIALFILVSRFSKADEKGKEKIHKFYLKNRKKINNWDFVDLTAPLLVGSFLFDKDRTILYKLAESKIIWDRRIAVLATFYFIKNHDFADAFALAEILINDKHDLIHKAVGWMLREIGNRDIVEEELFLKRFYKQMPRTMLRYAIEKFPQPKRKKYLAGEI